MSHRSATARSLHAADLRGLTRLGFDATVGITHLVESMHHAIASLALPIGAAPRGRPRGITGFVYGAVRGSARSIGRGVDGVLGAVLDALGPRLASVASTAERDAAIAILNGLWGDHLEATRNPLAIPMCVRVDGQALTLSHAALRERLPDARGRLLVLVHGLCMNDRQWTRGGHNHGRALARDLGMTPVWLHYNSGRHVSDNGDAFAQLLEQLVAAWPVPVTDLSIVAHSMGGLVARSACHAADQHGLQWRRSLRRLVCLGTPHHGAPLERGGRLVDAALQLSPYVAPFARLGQARSAGITDLRFGNLQHADGAGRDRHAQRVDDRVPTPLPSG
ncbi:MAG: GPI inositol-deacylase, partial [Burkholderiaceae bacterium]|nr:GPI inositol-deacylase [Burkholderiaceae bacterium]